MTDTARPSTRRASAPAGAMDGHGNPITGTSEAIATYDRAIDRLLRFHPDVLDLAGELTERHPDVPMGHALVAYLHLMGTDTADLPGASAASRALDGLDDVNEREAAHRAAVGAWVRGDWVGASRTLDRLLTRWPEDLLALAMGHQLDFFLGDAANLRDRPGRTLPELDPAHPHTAFVRGMQAFGLEEAGHYGMAEAAGLAAVEANRDDVWGIHAVVHTYEMQGQVDTGIRFLDSRVADWGEGNLFTVHNWWHLALYALEAGAFDEALSIYDTRVHHPGSAGVPIEMLDASALLWRLLLEGAPVGDRFSTLADAWATRTTEKPWYAFNDLHAVMALAGAGRLVDARAVIERLERYLAGGDDPSRTNLMMTAEVGLPACRAVVAFAEERFDDAFETLMPIRRHLARFGGSHAQRDALQRTTLEAALRAGRTDDARALVDERLSVRETSVYGWTRRARLAEATGDQAAAQAAADAAAAHQARFAAARSASEPPRLPPSG